MNRWSTRRTLGVWLGFVALIAAWGAAAWAGQQLANQVAGPPASWPLTPRSFGYLIMVIGGLALGGVFFYRALSALMLSYRVDRNAVTIHWLGNQAVVPMDRITAVEIGAPLGRLPKLWGALFGYYRGIGKTTDGHPVVLYATGSLKQAVALHTADSIYVISPRQRDTFIQEVEGRRGLGVVQSQIEGIIRSSRVSYPFWTDKIVRAVLGIGLLLNLALWGILSTRYTELAPFVDLRFDATGAPAAIAPREQVLALPLLGLLAWLANTGIGVAIYRSSRIGAVLLLIGSCVIQGLLAVALGRLMLNV